MDTGFPHKPSDGFSTNGWKRPTVIDGFTGDNNIFR